MRQIAEDSAEREMKWKLERERIKFERWRAYGLQRKFAGVTSENAGVKLRFVESDSCEKSREEEASWKGRRDQFVGIIERENDASRMNPVAGDVYGI